VDARWDALEYQVLWEDRPVEDAARLLGRDQEEGALKARLFWEADFAGWYARNRCRYSPRKGGPLLRLARRIAAQDFGKVVAEDPDVLCQVCRALLEAFRRFDPAKGQASVPVNTRFVWFFRRQFKRQMAWRGRQLRERRERVRAVLRGRYGPGAPCERRGRGEACDAPEEAEDFCWWATRMLELALQRLGPPVDTVVRLRLEGESVQEVARRVGLSPKRLSNGYSETRLVELIQHEVRAAMLDLPEERLRGLVGHLVLEACLSRSQVEGLLCLRADEMAGVLRTVLRQRGSAPCRQEALRLLQPTKRHARTA
jgi:hypothetical protein